MAEAVAKAATRKDTVVTRTGAFYTAYTVHHPAKLDSAVQDAIFSGGGLDVAMRAFGETADTVTEESTSSHFRHMFNGDLLLAVVPSDRMHLVAHILVTVYPLPGHQSEARSPTPCLDAVVVANEHQGQGLLTALLQLLVLQHPEWRLIATRTQNPYLLLALKRLGTVYPLTPPTPAIRQLGSSLAAAFGNAEYCNENMVVRRHRMHWLHMDC